VAVDEQCAPVGARRRFGVDERMAVRRLDQFDAQSERAQFVGHEDGCASDIPLVGGERTDAGNAQEFTQLGHVTGLMFDQAGERAIGGHGSSLAAEAAAHGGGVGQRRRGGKLDLTAAAVESIVTPEVRPRRAGRGESR